MSDALQLRLLSPVCYLCGEEYAEPKSFVVWRKRNTLPLGSTPSLHGVRLCRSCGLSEFQKGHESIWWFNPYYQAKARRYIKRGL